MSRSKDFKHSGEATQVTIRVNEDLRDAYDEAIDGNRSEAIREHMKEVADQDTDDHPLADEPKLRQAHDTLTDLVSESNRVRTEVAKSKVADQLNEPKESVRQSVFARLEQHGLIRPEWGHIRVGEL